MGFEPGLNAASEQRVTRLLIEETRDFARSIERILPGDFSLELYDQMLRTL